MFGWIPIEKTEISYIVGWFEKLLLHNVKRQEKEKPVKDFDGAGSLQDQMLLAGLVPTPARDLSFFYENYAHRNQLQESESGNLT